MIDHCNGYFPIRKVSKKSNLHTSNKVSVPRTSNQIFPKKNVRDNVISNKEDIFKYIIFSEKITQGYNRQNIEMFNIEDSKTAIKEYLYDGLGGPKIDAKITNNYRTKGWLLSVTLAYFRIDTKVNRNVLSKHLNEKEAIKLIDEFVDKYY